MLGIQGLGYRVGGGSRVEALQGGLGRVVWGSQAFGLMRFRVLGFSLGFRIQGFSI